ncbi:MAG TPA: ferritin-like protein [Usitatibacter sp.]|nr:ferritin-like protein [Usitatibacter sp.]
MTNGPGREQLLHLLAEAAEIEHNLLCCYLYAAFSLKRSATEGLRPEEAAAVVSWHESIMGIALEEMAHLAMVANLTVAIGGRPHFNRPNLPVPPGYHPADLIVKLARFDMDTLDHFIYLERPAGATVADGKGFDHYARYERSASAAGRAVMPYAADYETVAELYQALRDGFVSLADDIGEEALFRGDEKSQVGGELLKLPALVTVAKLESALSAIDTIIVQGEGSGADIQDSHYARFCTIKQEYTRLLAARPAFEPAWPAATNPVMRRPIDAKDRAFVESRRAAEVLDISNSLYNLLLRLLGQAYARARPDEATTSALLGLAMKSMRVFGMTAEYLATLPASDGEPHVHAGVTFTIFRATEPLAEGESEWAVIAERVNEIAIRLREVASGTPALQAAMREVDALRASASQRANRGVSGS